MGLLSGGATLGAVGRLGALVLRSSIWPAGRASVRVKINNWCAQTDHYRLCAIELAKGDAASSPGYSRRRRRRRQYAHNQPIRVALCAGHHFGQFLA